MSSSAAVYYKKIMHTERLVKVSLTLYNGMVIKAIAMRVTNNDLSRAVSTKPTPGIVLGVGRELTFINKIWKAAVPTLIKYIVSHGSGANLIMDNTDCDHNFEVTFVGVHNGDAISKVFPHTVMITRIM